MHYRTTVDMGDTQDSWVKQRRLTGIEEGSWRGKTAIVAIKTWKK